MREYYPEIYLPEKLVDYNTNWRKYIFENNRPPIPTQPILPIEPLKCKFSVTLLTYFSVILFVISYAFTKEISSAFIGLVVTSFCYSAYIIYKIKFEYPKLMLQYKNDLSRYNNESDKFIEQANKSIFEYKQLQDNYKNTTWREQQRIYWLQGLVEAKNNSVIEYQNPKKGKSEASFLKCLKEEFGDLILVNKAIEIFNYREKIAYDYDSEFEYQTQKKSDAYAPDFILHIPNINLFIDIEIDEQFDVRGNPIHGINNFHDNKRNNYFLNQNWVIIRFSESQILNCPKECCKEIGFLIDDSTGIKDYSQTLIDTKKLICQPKYNKHIKNELDQNRYVTPTDMNGIWESNDSRYIITGNEFAIEHKVSLTEYETYQKGFIKHFTNFDNRVSFSFKSEDYFEKYELRNWITVNSIVLLNIFNKEYLTLNRIDS